MASFMQELSVVSCIGIASHCSVSEDIHFEACDFYLFTWITKSFHPSTCLILKYTRIIYAGFNFIATLSLHMIWQRLSSIMANSSHMLLKSWLSSMKQTLNLQWWIFWCCFLRSLVKLVLLLILFHFYLFKILIIFFSLSRHVVLSISFMRIALNLLMWIMW